MLLAIDSSTPNTGLAIYDGNNVRYECIWKSADYHSVDLAPGIQQALKQTGLHVRDLKVVVVAIGPGSFTGLRIGLALAKGLAFTNSLALIAIPTLDVLAAGQPVEDFPMAAVLQAGRGRIAVGWYEVKKETWVAKGEPVLTTAQELSESINKPTRVTGELLEEDRNVLGRKYKNAMLASPTWGTRRPAILAELGWERWKAGAVTEPAGLAPIYLQAGEAVLA
jgi:tRNA threonylcarbamoyladenosine biosynthesis protein TsaB